MCYLRLKIDFKSIFWLQDLIADAIKFAQKKGSKGGGAGVILLYLHLFHNNFPLHFYLLLLHQVAATFFALKTYLATLSRFNGQKKSWAP